MIHAMYLALVFSYDMYPEVEEGYHDQTWKDYNVFDFWKIYDIISNQMIKYNPTHWKYVGDATMRPATYQNQVSRDKRNNYAREKIGRPS